MGKVDRLRNRVDPFAALFWALDLQIPDPARPGITPQPYACPYMVIVGAPFPIYCRYVIYLWSQQPTSCCWRYREQLCNSAIAGQGAQEQWEAGGDTGELVDNGHAIWMSVRGTRKCRCSKLGGGRQAGVRRAGHPRQMSRHSDTIARQNWLLLANNFFRILAGHGSLNTLSPLYIPLLQSPLFLRYISFSLPLSLKI